MYALTRRTQPMPNPFREMAELERAFFGRPFGSLSTEAHNSFRTDVTDRGDHYLLQTDLPGFAREEISLELQEDLLTIRAEHSTDTKEEAVNFLRRERSHGAYRRSFRIDGIDTEKIRAKYENGVLNVTLPKQEEQQPALRRLEIE